MQKPLTSNLPAIPIAIGNSSTARIAASLFFLVCLPLGIWDQFYVPQKVFVPNNPVATAHNLLSNEFIFRTSIVSHVFGLIIFVFMILLFYRLFRPVDKHLSRLMIAPVLLTIPIVFVFEVFKFTALMMLKGEPRPTFDVAQQQEVAYYLIRMNLYGTGAGMGKLLLGLCFVPFGMLVLRSGMAPRIIGILMIIGGVGYISDCCVSILLQRPDYLMVRSYLIFSSIGYFVALLWFVVKGVRDPKLIPDQ